MQWEQLAQPKPIFPGTPIADRVLASPLWVAQLKVDGVRALVTVGRSTVTAVSKHGTTLSMPLSVVSAVKTAIPAQSILDCELLTSSNQLWVFDIMQVAGADIASRPLSERLLRLYANVPSEGAVRTVQTIRERKLDYYNAVIEAGGEGVVLKRLQDPYPRGGILWLKLKPIRN